MAWKITPPVAAWKTFTKIDAYNKKYHPFRFFLVDTVPTFFSNASCNVREAYWYVMHRIHPAHRYHILDTKLPYGYYDIPVIMLYASFALLVRYVEDEECFTTINWNSTTTHACVADELHDLYYWWTEVRPHNDQKYNKLYDQLKEDTLFPLTTSDATSAIYNKVNVIEQQQKTLDMYNLKRLVAIKDFMWT